VALVEPIAVEGLRDLSRRLRAVDTSLPKALRLAANEAAEIVVLEARRDVPRKSGKAAKSIKAKSTRTSVRITSGGNRAPYMPWLDFGGRVGKNDTAKRPFIADGRYLWPAIYAKRQEVEETFRASLARIIADAGLEVT
jgi:HK97 gp10 family phage protein